MGKHYENLEEAMCKELEMLDKKYGADSAEMTVQDVEKADKLYHALKSAATYHAMKDAEEMDEEEDEASGSYRGGRMDRSYGRGYGRRSGRGRSYRRGRDSMGRYVSRGMEDGYSEMMYPRYPDEYDGDWRY